MKSRILIVLLLLFLLTAVPAFAQDTGIVQVGNHPTLGPILVAPNGMTLYTFANDQPGVSNCVAQCLELWPAYVVDANVALAPAAGVPGEISVITRPDGLLHVTYNGQPLYFYSSDVQPGDANGEGVGNVWFVVHVQPPAAPQVSLDFLLNAGANRNLGSILVASNGMTLYTFANDQPGVSNCVGECINLWPPFTVDAAATMNAAPGIVGTIGTLARPDGLTQVTLDNKPLYFYSGDTQPGNVNGQGVGNVWYSVPLDLVRVGGSPQRAFLVGSNGMTLYMFANDEPNWSNCLNDCATNWPPLAFTTDTPIIASSGIQGALATTLRPDNTYQVTFNGHPLYYFANDTAPGQTNGDGAGGVWSVAGVIPVARLGGSGELGTFLVDNSFRTLYVFANDTPGASTCVDACATNWPPLLVPAGAFVAGQGVVPGTLGTIQRPDGTIQATLDGKPLYTFVNDTGPGSALGNGSGGVWSVVSFPAIPFEGLPTTCTATALFPNTSLFQNPTGEAAVVRTMNPGEVVTVDTQHPSEGFIWWHLTTGEWARSDQMSELTPCAGLPQLAATGGQQQVAPAATPEVVAPATTPESVAPVTTPEAVAPAVTPEVIAPAATPDVVVPVATPEVIAPASTPEVTG